MVCQECGTRNPEDAWFCFNCATPLSPVPQVAAVQPQPYAPHPVQPKKRRLMKSCLLVSGGLFALVLFCGGIAAVTSDGDHHREVERGSAALECVMHFLAFHRT